MRSLGSFELIIGNEKTKTSLRLPLKYYLASEDTKIEGFHMCCPKCESRIRQKNICPNCNSDVPYAEANKLYEIGKEQKIVFTKDEYKELFDNEKSIEVKFKAIIPKGQINPLMLQKNPYYLMPSLDKKSKYINSRTLFFYGMLKEALSDDYCVIADIVLRSTKYLVCVYSFNSFLIMQLLHYADEIRDIPEIEECNLNEQQKQQAKEWLKLIASDNCELNINNEAKEKFKDVVIDIVKNGKKPIKKEAVIDNTKKFENPFEMGIKEEAEIKMRRK